jgi:exosortase A
LLLIFALIGYQYQDTFRNLFSLWNDILESDYGHGYLVVLISIYLVYDRRTVFADLTIRPSYLGLLFVCIVSLCWAISVIVGVMLTQGVGIVFLVFGVIWALLGSAYIKNLAFPILYLLFAIPIWSLLSPPLQSLTADVVYPLVRFFDVPALRDQYSIILPSGSLIIEEACSGLRYLLAALTLSVLYAYLNYSTLKARIAVIMIAIFAAVLANILRVFIIVKLAYDSEMQHPWVNDHLMMGWILFGGIMFMLLAFDLWLYKRRRSSIFSNDGQKMTGISDQKLGRNFLNLNTKLPAALAIPFAVMIGPALAHKYLEGQNEDLTAYDIVMPVLDDSWLFHELGNTTLDWRPCYNGAVEQVADYIKGNDSVRVYVGFYPHQTQGKELVNAFNNIAGNNGWAEANTRAAVITYNNEKFLETRVRHENGRQLFVWYRYRVAGHITNNTYIAKALQAWGLLSGDTTASVIAYAVTINNKDTHEAAREILGDFSGSIIEWALPVKAD